MKRVDQKILIIAAVAMASALSGCETTSDKQNRLTGVGSLVVGSVVGVLVNNAMGSAVASAVAGLATAAVSNYRSKPVSSTAEERRVYEAKTAISSPQVKIQKGGNSPKWVRAGQKVTIWTTYWLNIPAGKSTAFATESWIIKGKDISPVTLGPTHGERKGGKREATLDFVIPKGITPGTYTIEHRVQSGSSSDTSVSKFIVIS